MAPQAYAEQTQLDTSLTQSSAEETATIAGSLTPATQLDGPTQETATIHGSPGTQLDVSTDDSEEGA